MKNRRIVSTAVATAVAVSALAPTATAGAATFNFDSIIRDVTNSLNGSGFNLPNFNTAIPSGLNADLTRLADSLRSGAVKSDLITPEMAAAAANDPAALNKLLQDLAKNAGTVLPDETATKDAAPIVLAVSNLLKGQVPSELTNAVAALNANKGEDEVRAEFAKAAESLGVNNIANWSDADKEAAADILLTAARTAGATVDTTTAPKPTATTTATPAPATTTADKDDTAKDDTDKDESVAEQLAESQKTNKELIEALTKLINEKDKGDKNIIEQRKEELIKEAGVSDLYNLRQALAKDNSTSLSESWAKVAELFGRAGDAGKGSDGFRGSSSNDKGNATVTVTVDPAVAATTTATTTAPAPAEPTEVNSTSPDKPTTGGEVSAMPAPTDNTASTTGLTEKTKYTPATEAATSSTPTTAANSPDNAVKQDESLAETGAPTGLMLGGLAMAVLVGVGAFFGVRRFSTAD